MSDPVQHPDGVRHGFRRLTSGIGRFGPRAARVLLTQAPRVASALLLRSLGAAFDQQVLRWIASSASVFGDLW